MDDDSKINARLAYRTALAPRQTARLGLAIVIISGVVAPMIKAIISLM